MQKLMTVAEVAEYLQMDEATIQKWIRTGNLPAMALAKEYRIGEDDLTAWLASRMGKRSTMRNGIRQQATA